VQPAAPAPSQLDTEPAAHVAKSSVAQVDAFGEPHRFRRQLLLDSITSVAYQKRI
jgi:hypothetical protein